MCFEFIFFIFWGGKVRRKEERRDPYHIERRRQKRRKKGFVLFLFGERTLLPIWKYQVEKKSNI